MKSQRATNEIGREGSTSTSCDIKRDQSTLKRLHAKMEALGVIVIIPWSCAGRRCWRQLSGERATQDSNAGFRKAGSGLQRARGLGYVESASFG